VTTIRAGIAIVVYTVAPSRAGFRQPEHRPRADCRILAGAGDQIWRADLRQVNSMKRNTSATDASMPSTLRRIERAQINPWHVA
jgi:hypothetical protein